MPSFDIVSEVDKHELTNAVDQMNREVSNRFDFKGSDARVNLKEFDMNLEAASDFQVHIKFFKVYFCVTAFKIEPV